MPQKQPRLKVDLMLCATRPNTVFYHLLSGTLP